MPTAAASGALVLTANPQAVQRDRWGRPLVIPPGGGSPVAYTRASTLAKALDDTSNLTAWKLRTVAVGLARRPDLRARVAGVLASYPDDPVADGKRDLNGILDAAADAGGGGWAASMGTAWHELTAAVDLGADPWDLVGLDEGVAARLVDYRDATALLDVLAVERFVVVDGLQVAGTLDRLYRLPDGRVVVGDLKTGSSDPAYPLAVAVQVATYAHGVLYDPDTGAREPLHPDLDTTTGLLVHLPQRGKGCRVYVLDLVAGWGAAQAAAVVREVRRLRPPDLALPWGH